MTPLRRFWRWAFGGRYDGQPDPPVKRIRAAVEDYRRRFQRSVADERRPPEDPFEWFAHFAVGIWRSGFEAGLRWEEDSWEQRLRHAQRMGLVEREDDE